MGIDICGALHPENDLACGRAAAHRRLPAPDNARHWCFVKGETIEWTGEQEKDEITEPFFQDVHTSEPCPRRGNLMCTVTDPEHRHVSIQVAEQRKAKAERGGVVGEVIDRRVQVYGNPIETFARIAEVWSGILGHHVNPVEVPLLMAGMKMVRAQVMPDYSDNSDDIAGYMDIFRQLVGDDMIHARTVNEFIAQKWPEQGNG